MICGSNPPPAIGTMNDPALLPPEENVSFTTASNGITHLTPTLNYSDYGTVFLTDPGGWGGGPRRSGFVGAPDITDEIQAIRLAATRKFDEAFFLNDVSFGVNYADRTKGEESVPEQPVAPGQYLACGRAGGIPHRHCRLRRSSAARTASSATTRSGLYRSGFWQPINSIDDPNANSNDRINNVMNTWEVNEKLTTVFVKFGIDTELDGLPLRGNIGVQAIHGRSDFGSASHEHGRFRRTRPRCR